MRLSFLIFAAACAKPLAGQLPIRAVDETAPANETAPAVNEAAPTGNEAASTTAGNDAAPVPSGNASTPSTGGSPISTAGSDPQAGAAALDALVKRRLPAG